MLIVLIFRSPTATATSCNICGSQIGSVGWGLVARACNLKHQHLSQVEITNNDLWANYKQNIREMLVASVCHLASGEEWCGDSSYNSTRTQLHQLLTSPWNLWKTKNGIAPQLQCFSVLIGAMPYSRHPRVELLALRDLDRCLDHRGTEDQAPDLIGGQSLQWRLTQSPCEDWDILRYKIRKIRFVFKIL